MIRSPGCKHCFLLRVRSICRRKTTDNRRGTRTHAPLPRRLRHRSSTGSRQDTTKTSRPPRSTHRRTRPRNRRDNRMGLRWTHTRRRRRPPNSRRDTWRTTHPADKCRCRMGFHSRFRRKWGFPNRCSSRRRTTVNNPRGKHTNLRKPMGNRIRCRRHRWRRGRDRCR